MSKSVPAVQVHLLDPAGNRAPFRLAFYGFRMSDLLTPSGRTRIEAALKRRGLEGYTTTPVMIRRTY